MKNRLLISLLTLSLFTNAGCSESNKNSIAQPELPAFSNEEAQETISAISKWVGENDKVLFTCGASKGIGLFTLEWGKGFQSDGMKDGRQIFILRSDGSVDLIFRDAGGRYISTIEDGGQVVRMGTGQQESWIVGYTSTGITETHNVTSVGDKLVNLWTSNKPTSLVGANAKLFHSICIENPPA